MAPTGDLSLEFRLLGTFEVAAGGRVVEIGSLKQRALLALLVVHLNRPVSSDTLIEELWRGNPPASVAATVQSLVYRLRRALGDAGAEAAGVALRGRGSAYVLEADQLQVDANRFEGLVARGRQLLAAGAAERAASALADALALWRGPALDGLADGEFARVEAIRLEEARLSAVEALSAAELARERPEAVVALLEPHLAANPLRENAWGQLMVALYRQGRQAEALRAYQELRRVLGEELGLEPNPALRQLEQQILLQSPELGASPPASAVSARATPEDPPVREVAQGGLTTVVFTDVEGSTALQTDRGGDVAQEILRRHEHLVRQLLVEHAGREVKSLGDGFLATFGSARGALTFALALQRSLEEQRWASAGEALRVRIGINAGEVVEEGGDVLGQAVDAAARITAKGEGGQILVSEVVRRLVGSVPELKFRDAGRFRLKGFAERWRLFELVSADTKPVAAAARETRTPLVGRDPEVAALRASLDQTMAGSGALVLLVGEPGIGKTRLTEELAAEALRSKALVFAGRCLEAEGAPPYAPIAEILENALAQAPSPDAFRAAAGDAAPEIARLLPRLRRLFPDIGPALALPPEQERRYLFNSIGDMLTRTARVVPTVLIMEDLHWADEASLLLLDHLARHLAAPVLILGTYRDSELDIRPALAQTLDGLVRDRLVRQLHLARLSERALAQMLGALAGDEPPDAVVDLVFKETEGNPFFVEEVFRHLAEEGRLLDADGRFRPDAAIGELDVPDNVRLVVGRRLDRLSEDARQVLGVAAVIGRTFHYEMLEAAAPLGGDVVLDAIDVAERARLVLANHGQVGVEEFNFVHELVRQTLLARLSAPRRRRLHVAVAEAMERVLGRAAEDHAADVAHHLVEAGAAAAPVNVVRWLILAGRFAMASAAFEEALRHYERAAIIDELAEPAERAELLFELGTARCSAGRWDTAVEAWRQSADAFEQCGDGEGVARVCAAASYSLAWLARWAEAIEMSQRGLVALGDRVTPERGRLLGMTGCTTAWGGEYPTGIGMIDEELQLANRLEDASLLAHALSMKALAHHVFVEYREVVEAGRRAATVLDEPDDLWTLASVAGFMAFGLVYGGRFDEFPALDDEFAPLAERLGNDGAILCFRRMRALVAYLTTGDLDRVEALARADREFCEKAGLPWVSSAWSWSGLARFLRGDWDDALELFREAVRLEPPGVLCGWNAALLFECLAYRGERTAALDLLDARVLPRPGEPKPWGATAVLVTAVDGLVVLGERERAAELYPSVVDVFVRTGTVCPAYDDARLCQRAAGIAAMAGQRFDAAEEHFRTALRQAAELPHRPEEAHTRRWYGQMLLERGSPGDRDQAEKVLAAAIENYERMGMPRHRQLTAALLLS